MNKYRITYRDPENLTDYVTANSAKEAEQLFRRNVPEMTFVKAEPMHTFEVTFQTVGTYTTVVEAIDEEDAKNKIFQYRYNHLDEVDTEVQNIINVQDLGEVEEEE